MLIRSILIYLLVLFVIRLMGKRQIGEMQPFEFVITLIIADLACIPMSELSVPLVHGVVPILSLLLLHFFICVFARKSMRVRFPFFWAKITTKVRKNEIWNLFSLLFVGFRSCFTPSFGLRVLAIDFELVQNLRGSASPHSSHNYFHYRKFLWEP